MGRHFDSLPRLQLWDSPKGRSRLRVSSALRYAFGRGVQRWPPDDDRGSAFQRVQPGQTGLPTRTRRAWFERALLSRHIEGTESPRSSRDEHPSSTVGYAVDRVPPFASDPWAGTWRSGSPALLPGWRGRETPVGAEDPVPQPGNAVTHQYGRAGLNGSGQHSQPATERWPALPCRFRPTAKAVGFRLVTIVIT